MLSWKNYDFHFHNSSFGEMPTLLVINKIRADAASIMVDAELVWARMSYQARFVAKCINLVWKEVFLLFLNIVNKSHSAVFWITVNLAGIKYKYHWMEWQIAKCEAENYWNVSNSTSYCNGSCTNNDPPSSERPVVSNVYLLNHC